MKFIAGKRTPLKTVLLGAMMTGALCAGSSASAQTLLKFSHTDQPGGARNAAALLFAKSVENYTQGRYKVQIYPAGQLANDPKVWNNCNWAESTSP